MADVFIRSYELPPVDRREVMGYAGVRGDAPDIISLLDECISELSGLNCKVCYAELPQNSLTSLSRGLRKALDGYETAVIFAATVGIAIDRLIARYSLLSPAKALLFQAIGAERIEALCDAFQNDIAKEDGADVGTRFSPGYGDLPLEYQREIFALLDCHRRIGLTLNESLLMSPSKSVTAIFGRRKRSE